MWTVIKLPLRPLYSLSPGQALLLSAVAAGAFMATRQLLRETQPLEALSPQLQEQVTDVREQLIVWRDRALAAQLAYRDARLETEQELHTSHLKMSGRG